MTGLKSTVWLCVLWVSIALVLYAQKPPGAPTGLHTGQLQVELVTLQLAVGEEYVIPLEPFVRYIKVAKLNTKGDIQLKFSKDGLVWGESK